ncbi:3-phosphoserine/phosphohydroxythreonine transaminase [Buchnera aphidicola (Kurisakia onigurumii)]|uniref:3-phosphoserine/phosphohydroxythreonine transaminase n=1 Tax=Buchnera aphidicola TaxID=9 RepID=UPI0031B6D2BF
MKKIYNFSAGPAMLPIPVMKKAKKYFRNWKNTGSSVIEISHRSDYFVNFLEKMKKNLRLILNIPKDYKILFCQGGARGQFSAIPMNLLKKNKTADYICSGYWSQCAAEEAKKYCVPNIINIRNDSDKKKKIIPLNEWFSNEKISYVHYCPNETIEGIAIEEEPEINNYNDLIGDFSSTILSKKIEIQKYSVIYASAQKNIGPAGITLIIIKKSLLKKKKNNIPSILDYNIISHNKSMFNTPTTFSLYIAGLVFQWIINIGGIKNIEKKNLIKSKLLYNIIDKTGFYINNVEINNRSKLNIPFQIINPKLTEIFLQESFSQGLLYLKGHSLIGGLRASIYNAMPIQGVKKLVKFMKYFENKYG